MPEHTALVTGATGTVGSGIARTLIEEGWTVIAPSRTPERLGILRGKLGDKGDRLIGVQYDLSHRRQVEELRDDILERGIALKACVACMNTPLVSKELLDVTDDEWQRALHGNLTTHLYLAQVFIPELMKTRGTSYTFITGAGGESAWPRYGLMAVPVAGVIHLARNLTEELKRSDVRLNTLVIGAFVKRDDDDRQVDFPTVSHTRVGALVHQLALGSMHSQFYRFNRPEQLEQLLTDLPRPGTPV